VRLDHAGHAEEPVESHEVGIALVLEFAGPVVGQVQPPCIDVLTMTIGPDSAIRSSAAATSIVCVPPPLAPVMAIRVGSTSGRERTKSMPRMPLSVWRPMMLWRCDSACGL